MTSLSAVVPIDGTHDLSEFRCGKPELDEWLQRHALVNHAAGSTRTYVTCEGRFVRGYHALAASSIEFEKASRKLKKALGRYPIPVVLLARLAVDIRHQGQHVGEALLLDALRRAIVASDQIGVRAVLVHAMDDDARAFYERYDFEPSPTDPLHLTLMMQDIRASLA